MDEWSRPHGTATILIDRFSTLHTQNPKCETRCSNRSIHVRVSAPDECFRRRGLVPSRTNPSFERRTAARTRTRTPPPVSRLFFFTAAALLRRNRHGPPWHQTEKPRPHQHANRGQDKSVNQGTRGRREKSEGSCAMSLRHKEWVTYSHGRLHSAALWLLLGRVRV